MKTLSISLPYVYVSGQLLNISSISVLFVVSSSYVSFIFITFFVKHLLTNLLKHPNVPPHHGALGRLNCHLIPCFPLYFLNNHHSNAFLRSEINSFVTLLWVYELSFASQVCLCWIIYQFFYMYLSWCCTGGNTYVNFDHLFAFWAHLSINWSAKINSSWFKCSPSYYSEFW